MSTLLMKIAFRAEFKLWFVDEIVAEAAVCQLWPSFARGDP